MQILEQLYLFNGKNPIKRFFIFIVARILFLLFLLIIQFRDWKIDYIKKILN